MMSARSANALLAAAFRLQENPHDPEANATYQRFYNRLIGVQRQAAAPMRAMRPRRGRERRPGSRARRSSARSGDSGSDDSDPPPPGVDWRWAHQGRWSA